jgi:hypothetical protein
VHRYRKARSREHCCRGKEISITYSQFMFLALVIENAKRMSRIASCVQSGCTLFFPHYLINGTVFGKKSFNKMCVLIFSTTFV